MKAKMLTVSSMTLLVLLLGVCCNAETVVLDSVVTPGANFSLEYHLCEATDQLHSNTTMTLSAGTHGIRDNTACIVRDISNLTIRGTTEPGETSTILCLPSESAGFVIRGGGFFFINVTNLRIEHVLVVNCGAEIPSDLPAYVNSTYAYFGPRQKIAFLFSHCTDLQLENMTLSRGFGLGVVGINLMGDTELNSLTISDTDNSDHFLCIGILDVRLDPDCSGSGAAFVYYDLNTDAPQENTSLTINNCTFTNNINIIPNVRFLPLFVSVRSAFRTDPILITGASALGIYFAQRAYHVHFKLQNSVIENNDGSISGMVLLFYNTVRDTTVLIDGCDLIRNQARRKGQGGALIIVVAQYLDMLNSFPEYPDDVYEIVSITRSRFIGNRAAAGGAIYVHVTPQNISQYRISIDNTTFVSNVASVGSAIETASTRSTFTPKSHHLLLQDIVAYDNTFLNSDINRNSTPQNSGIFVFLLTNNVTVTGRFHTEGSKFYSNSPGVFLTAGANIFLRGHLEFSNNFGFNGGALSLYDYSVLFFHEGLKVRFVNNRALQSGGAIFANSLGTGIADVCVIQIIGSSLIFGSRDAHLLNLNITFVNNSAGESGNSIYANPLYACGYLPEASVQHTMFLDNEREVYDAVFKIESTVDNGLQEISSIPNRIIICNQTKYLAEFNNINTPRQQVQTIPGRQFTVFVVPVDAIGLPVSSLLYAEVDTPGIKLGPAQSIRQILGSNCSKVEFNVYGPENSYTDISLYTTPGGREAVLMVTVGPCPPGFEIDVLNGLKQCACDEYVLSKIGTTCNTTTYTIARPENSWIGTFDHGNGSRNDVIYISTCPIDYCNESVTNVDLTIEDQLCEYGRSGILCGQCRQNLSVVFGSAMCKQCSNYSLFTILGYGFAGILLVLVLFVLDLTVTKGTINGLIFYVNVVSVNSNIFFQGSSDSFLFIFISLLNLELGFPLCFFNGMNEIAKVGLQFVFPSYLLLISVGIILLSRWSSRIQKLTSFSGLHVLATLIYLSYAKTFRTVIDTLSFGTVHGSVDTHFIWLFDGNVVYLTGVHIFLFILAIVVVLVFLVPYTLPLLFVKLLQRYTKPRFKPLLDAYLGPYKDQWRYWFGLRLTIFITMCILYAVIGTDKPQLALLIQLYLVVLFTILQAFIQPFKNFAVELLDMSFMVNFIILTIGTSYIIDNEQRQEMQATLARLMVSLAFIAFCGIISYHIIRALQKLPTIKEKLDQLFARIKKLKPTYQKFKILKHQMKGVRNPDLPRNELESNAMTHNNMDDSIMMNSPLQSVPITEISLSDAEPPPDQDISYRLRSFSQLREPVLDY